MCECAQAEKLCVPIQPGSYLGLTLYLNVPAAETMNLALSFFFFFHWLSIDLSKSVLCQLSSTVPILLVSPVTDGWRCICIAFMEFLRKLKS